MAKDDRLYAKFTLDFPDSPKFIALSVDAKWAYVEMVIYSRRMMTDGFLASAVASARWGASVCLELLENDPTNPSLIEVENGYLIHDFAEHQTTKADLESLSEKRKSAGRRGGQASAEARRKQVLKQNPSKIKPETETETYISNTPSTFDEWWMAYPKKVGKKAAEPAYRQALKDIDAESLLSAAKSYAKANQQTDPKFIANPKTWLNQGRWDEFEGSSITPEDFLRDCWRRGSTGKITELTGWQPDIFAHPENTGADYDATEARQEHYRRCITDNRDELLMRLKEVI